MRKHRPLRLLTILYTVIMLYLLFFQRQPRCWKLPYSECLRSGLELELFRATKRYLYIARYDLPAAILYLGGNVLCFVPLGALLSRHRPELGRTLRAAFGIVLAVELTQYFTTLGYFDIDDIFFNLLGVFFGWLCFRQLRLKRP